MVGLDAPVTRADISATHLSAAAATNAATFCYFSVAIVRVHPKRFMVAPKDPNDATTTTTMKKKKTKGYLNYISLVGWTFALRSKSKTDSCNHEFTAPLLVHIFSCCCCSRIKKNANIFVALLALKSWSIYSAYFAAAFYGSLFPFFFRYKIHVTSTWLKIFIRVNGFVSSKRTSSLL